MNQDVDPSDDAYTFGCGGYESGQNLAFKDSSRDMALDAGRQTEQCFNEMFMYAKEF